MDNRPIGVFDSGLGGLTAVKELIRILPQENIVYFGDTGRVPYGSRSRDTIIRYATQDIAFLRSKQVKIVIAACGTVSSVAQDIGDHLPVPFTGVLGPTAAAAAAATKSGRIGVIGTTATIRSGSYRRELAKRNPSLAIFEQDCPLFVPLVENGFVAEDEVVTRLVAERYLAPLKEQNIDTLIMGCTHYPIIRHILSRVMGQEVTLIDSGRETALYAAKLLKQQGLLCDGSQKSHLQFYVSDQVEGFSSIAKLFLEQDIGPRVAQVDINRFS